MKKYCFEFTETKKKTTLVRIDAETKEDAERIIEKLYRANRISFQDAEVDIDYEYQIDKNTCNADLTFDDINISDELIQSYKESDFQYF